MHGGVRKGKGIGNGIAFERPSRFFSFTGWQKEKESREQIK